MCNSLTGNKIKAGNTHIFFGNSQTSFEAINKAVNTLSVHQVHGNRIVEAKADLRKADGHFTDKANTALIIKTADCMPVFLKNGPRIFGLHIGWRGLMKKILTESSVYWLSQHPVELWLGPHIEQKCFELDTLSTEMLLAPHHINLEVGLKTGIIKTSISQRNHYLVSLKDLLQIEAKSLGIKKFHYNGCDTYTSYQHNSYRRNRHKIARNYSFIIKN